MDMILSIKDKARRFRFYQIRELFAPRYMSRYCPVLSNTGRDISVKLLTMSRDKPTPIDSIFSRNCSGERHPAITHDTPSC